MRIRNIKYTKSTAVANYNSSKDQIIIIPIGLMSYYILRLAKGNFTCFFLELCY